MGVTIGSYIYGIVGALFAVPVMAMIKVVVQSLRHPMPEVGSDHPSGTNWPEVLSNARNLGARALPSRGPRRGRTGTAGAAAPDAAGTGSPAERPTSASGTESDRTHTRERGPDDRDG